MTTAICLLLTFILGPMLGTKAPHPTRPDASTRQQPLVMEVDRGEVELVQEPGTDRYRATAPFRIDVGSILPRWRISCIPDVPPLPRTSANVRPPRLMILPEKSLSDPGKRYAGAPVPLDGSMVLVAGGPTAGRMIEANSFTLVAEVDPISPPGRYSGSLRLVPEVPGAGYPEDYVFGYSWNVVELLAVYLRVDVLEFGSVLPGVSESRNSATFTVHSNHLEAEITVSLDQMAGVNHDAVLPGDATCIGWGFSPAAARSDVLSAPFGRNDVTFSVGPGRHDIAVHARLNLTTAQPAGEYSGRIVITSRVVR